MAAEPTERPTENVMETAGLLRSAANLIAQALSRLDVEAHNCAACGRREFANKLHATTYENINELPNRLNRAAKKLLGVD